MTVPDEPIVGAPDDPAMSLARRHPSPGAWRLSVRLARREVRRRPGRTALVALLVAVPMFAMTIGSIVVHSNTDSARFSRSYGNADFSIGHDIGNDPLTPTGDRRQAENSVSDVVDFRQWAKNIVPEGTEITEYLTVWTSVTSADGTVEDAAVVGFKPSSMTTDGIIEIKQGRLPREPEEVLLHPTLLDSFDTALGDTLELSRPDRTLTVVGIGRATANYHDPVMVVGQLEIDSIREGYLRTLVNFPGDQSTGESLASDLVLSLDSSSNLGVHRWEVRGTSNWNYALAQKPTTTLAWGWVIDVLLLTAAGIIIAAAFATSARRQLATVGQLAANGASTKVVRRVLALQGTLSGAVGALIGIALGVTVFVLAIPLVERLTYRRWNEVNVDAKDLTLLFLTGVTAATLAALLPARSLANTSVLAALAGRRPIRAIKPQTVVIGGVCFLGGLLILAVAATSAKESNVDGDLLAFVALVGGVAVLAGMCLASPLAVSAASTAATRFGAVWRLSGRSLHRTRWRSSAVVTAIGVAGAIAVSSASAASTLDYSGDVEDMPRNITILRATGASLSSIEADVRADVRELVGPSAESIILGVDLPTPTDAQLEAYYADPDSYGRVFLGSSITVANEELLDGMGLSDRDRLMLDEVGVGSTRGESGPASVLGSDELIPVEIRPFADELGSRNGFNELVITQTFAMERGIDVIPVGIRFESQHDLTASQRRGLDDIRFGSTYRDAWIVDGETSAPIPNERSFWISYQYVNFTPPLSLIQGSIAAAALLLVLLVVGIGLSLTAAEGREERNTLIAIGASPSTMRRRSAVIALLLSATGGLIAVPTGLLPVWVVYRIGDTPIDIPWLVIVAVVGVIPLIVGAIAWGGSSIIQQVRPVHVMRRFAD